MSDAVHVVYDRIMCEQVRSQCVTKQQLDVFIRSLNEEQKNELLTILFVGDGCYGIPWVHKSLSKKKKLPDKNICQKPEKSEIIFYLTNEKNFDEFTAQGFADQFWNFYEQKNWMVGKNKMTNWKSAVALWLRTFKPKINESYSAFTRGSR